MKTIYFVRHCTPDISVHEDRIRPLNAQGQRDALRVAEFFRDIPVDRVVSSPYLRAMDTVRGVAEMHGLPVIPDEDLRERAVGAWVEDFDAFAQAQWADIDHALPGGESIRQTMQRGMGALERMLADPAQITVAGAHGTALCSLIHALDKRFGYADFRRIQSVMPWIVRFTFEGGCLTGWEPIEMA